MWSVARSHDLTHAEAADVAQTAWLRLVENLHCLHRPERVGAWLASTTRRECYRLSRRAARERPVEFMSDHGSGQKAEPSAEDAVLDLTGRQLVLEALGELSERCRTLLRMLASTPPPGYADVAETLNIPVGSIGPTRARCLDGLRQVLAARDVHAGRHDGN